MYGIESKTRADVPLLQPQLDAITESTRALVQPERLAVIDEAIAALLATGVEEKLIAVGAPAPAFALPDALTGRTVRSEDLLALGPVVVKFFRGRWCPYDMTELETWQGLQAEVRNRGALLVAVSAQLPRQNDFTVQRHGLAFPVLSDAGAATATAFGLAYTVAEAMQRHYRSVLVNVPFINGDQSWKLPLPATIVIGRDGLVKFVEAFADHRVRPEPEAVLAAI